LKTARLDPAALAELREASSWYKESWYKERSPDVARRFVQNVRALVRTITQAPLQFPVIREPALEIPVRRALVPGFPYAIVFIVGKDSRIHVLAIAHQHRMSGYWLHRIR
jgi:plasmid stabilization system protein ParE